MASIDERLLLVNRYGSLTVPGVLWIAMAFLARYWIVVAVVLLSARRSPETVRLLGQDFAWFMLAVELPVLLVMIAGGNRRPDAWRPWRAIWTRGRQLLLVIAALHLAAAAVALWASPVWRRWPDLFIASCAVLDLAIIYALAKDDYFRTLFADFPQAQPAPGKE